MVPTMRGIPEEEPPPPGGALPGKRATRRYAAGEARRREIRRWEPARPGGLRRLGWIGCARVAWEFRVRALFSGRMCSAGFVNQCVRGFSTELVFQISTMDRSSQNVQLTVV
jgi:hypothetical protein